ncbi:MAG TPA: hypothetical protein VK622_11265 [Puia sp.]|nr:hypothetical protein [Puia sp.]
MIKDSKLIDFITTGRQPSAKEFAMISEWIKQKKQQPAAARLRGDHKKKKQSV